MTFAEALSQKIPRVRLPEWNESAYLEPYYTADGYGPWVNLFDPIGAGNSAPIPILVTELTRGSDNRWELWSLPAGRTQEPSA